MLTAFLFDDGLPELAPLTDLRASFDVRTGALTTCERLCAAMRLRLVGLRVPAGLAALTSKRHSEPVNIPVPQTGPVLVINGRCVLPPEQAAGLRVGEALVEDASGHVVAAMLEPAAAQAFLETGKPAGCTPRVLRAPAMISRPWHVRRFRDEALKLDLSLLGTAERGALTSTQEPERSHRLETGVVHLGGNVVVQVGARVCPGATLDSEQGLIHIAQDAVIRPGAVL